ncbi:MAG: hypothetical protein WA213_20740 [Terriglobales bacterium]
MTNLSPSFRFPGVISDPSVPKSVGDALRLHSNALTDIYQAIPALKQQISALQGGQTVINNPGGGGGSSSFPGLGSVNNLQGDVAYTNQPTDNGALLLFGDSSSVAVQLTSGVQVPYFLFAQNWDSGMVTFTPSLGTISWIGNAGAASMPLAEGYSALLVFDGTNWWAETLPLVPQTFAPIAGEYLTGYSGTTGLFSAAELPLATDSSFGIVQPDGVTIGVDSGSGLLTTLGATGTIPLGPLTDSGASGSITVYRGLISAWISPT